MRFNSIFVFQQSIAMKTLFSVIVFFSLLLNTDVLAQSKDLAIKEDPRMGALLELNADMIKNNKIGQRYKIQLGSFSSMKTAQEIKSEFESKYRDFPVQLQYESPNYKVWVGDFTSRLAADRVFLKIKDSYKSAFVFKPSA